MKKLLPLLLLIVCTYTRVWAQYHNDSYLNISIPYQKQTELTDAIIFTKNYQEAKFLLNKLDINSYDYVSNSTLLIYNTYGKDSAMKYLSLSPKVQQDKDFVAWWVAELTHNIEDERVLMAAYKEKYKENTLMLKHQCMKIISENYSLEDESKDLLDKISYIERNFKPDSTDMLFLSLMKCQIYDDNDWRKCDIIDILSSLWEKYPDKMDKIKISEIIEDCETESCIHLRKKLFNLDKLSDNPEDINDFISYINEYIKQYEENDYSNVSIGSFILGIKNIINNTNSRLNQEKLKGIVKLMTMTSNYSSLLDDIEFEKLNYPLDFRKYITSSADKSDLHELLEDDIKEMTVIIPSIKDIINSEFSIDLDDYESLTREDISTLLGFKSLLYFQLEQQDFELSQLQTYLEDQYYSSMAVKEAEPQKDDFQRLEDRLDKNPIYELDSYYDFPDVTSYEDIKRVLDILQTAIHKYPGSSGLLLSKINLIKLYYDDYSAQQKALSYSLFDSAIDLFNIVQAMGVSDDYDFKMNRIFDVRTKSYFTKKSIEELFTILDRKEKMELMRKLEKLMSKKPTQKNLILLYESLQNAYFEK